MFENLRARFRRKTTAAPRAGTRLSLTALEDRTVPSGNPPLASGVLPLFAAPPGGTVHAGTGSGRQSGVQQSDLNFLTKSVQGDEQEMILGSLAMVLGQDQGVRSFGGTLYRDHARLFAAALPLLRQNGLSLPGLDADQLQHIQQLAALRGSDFDTAFVAYMVQDHRTDLQDIRTEAQTGNGSIRDYARQGLPVIREHFDIARSLQQRLGSGTGGGGGGGGSGTSSLSQQDQTFITTAAQGDEQEMILGSLEATLGTSRRVRNFGRMLLRDHAAAFAAAIPILDQNGITLSGPDANMLQNIQQISSRQGQARDNNFMNYMVQDHVTDMQDFTTEIQSGSDQQTKDYAQNWVIPIQEHMHIAQSLQQIQQGRGNGNGGSGGNSGGSGGNGNR